MYSAIMVLSTTWIITEDGYYPTTSSYAMDTSSVL